jgi:hypothetical protein
VSGLRNENNNHQNNMDDEAIDFDGFDINALMPNEYAKQLSEEMEKIKRRRISKADRQSEIDGLIDSFCRLQAEYGETDARHWFDDYPILTETIEELNYDPTYAYRSLIELLFEYGHFEDGYSQVVEWALDATTEYLDNDVKILEQLLKVCEVEEEDSATGAMRGHDTESEDRERLLKCKKQIESILSGTEQIEKEPEPVIIKNTDKELDRLMRELAKLSKMK